MIRKKIERVIAGILVTSMCFGLNGTYSNAKDVTQKKNNKGIYKEYLVKSDTALNFKTLIKKYKNKVVINHKAKDEMYSQKENVVTLKLSNEDAKELKDEKSYVVEENYELHGLTEENNIPEVPISIEDFKNKTGEEYSDNPEEFVPCEAVTDENQNEVLPWNIECVAGNPKENEYTGKGVKVAVIDSGIDVHNDLNTKEWVDFSDSVNGYKPIDSNGHGTEMAGVIAARDNGIGTIGIAPDAELYSVKVLDKDNKACVSSVVKAIEWCIDNDIDVINMSFGLNQYSAILEESIHKAYLNDITMVSAAGNKNSVEYPAKFDEVISVGGINKELCISSYSPVGNGVDVYAPSEECQTTGFVGSYVKGNGTSIAAAHVTGVVAALKSGSKNITNSQMKTLIKNTTVDFRTDDGVKYGVINYNNAILEYYNNEYDLMDDYDKVNKDIRLYWTNT